MAGFFIMLQIEQMYGLVKRGKAAGATLAEVQFDDVASSKSLPKATIHSYAARILHDFLSCGFNQ